jgi:small-conductance mechanosensitive channel
MDWIGDIEWVGLTAETFAKLRSTAFLVALVLVVTLAVRALLRALPTDRFSGAAFWTRQALSLAAAVALGLGLVSIWITRPESLTAVIGMVTAGLAFALQRVITSFAGYFIILRGKNFVVGDRISMGGVRGDVIDVGFFQTTILEMGQSRDEPDASTWVWGRQFTGRIVTVANSRIFEEPIYNYTKDFPVLWEEVTFHLPYGADRAKAEAIAMRATQPDADPARLLDEAGIRHVRERFDVSEASLRPRLFFRALPRSVECTLRFVVGAHRDRETKDAITRRLLDGFEAGGIRLGEG